MNKTSLRPYFKLAICCGVFLSLPVKAEQIPTGSQLLPQNPAARFPVQNRGTGLTVEQKEKKALDSKDTVLIRQIKVANNTIFDSQTLHSLVADGEGKKLNLMQLNELATRISRYYQESGHLVSRAYIPVQSINEGVLYINVIEARLGQVKVNNTSRLSPYRINTILSSLHSEQFVLSDNINPSLLLLNDLAGVKIRSVLVPSEKVGRSDLVVNVEPGDALNGSVGIDNYGSKYIGQMRYNALLKINNPAGQGDQIILDGLTTGHNMTSGHIGYRFPIYVRTTVGADLSGMRYKLKGNLSNLDANGGQTSTGLWASQIWMRNINTNVNSTLTYHHTDMDDEIGVAQTKKSRHSNVVVLSNSVEVSDSFGRTSVYLSGTAGNLSFDNLNDGGQFDADGAKTEGNFFKGNLHIARLQQFTDTTSLYLGVDGQIASKNLDSSEQLTLGGPFSTRSYNVGAVSGAQGYFATAELRHTVSNRPDTGSWTPMVFIDTGHVQVYKNQFVDGDNSANLSSSGVGLDVNWSDWFVSARYAHRIGGKPAATLVGTVDDNKFWIQVNRNF